MDGRPRKRFDANGNLVTEAPGGSSKSQSAGLTAVQKAVICFAAVMIGPSLVMQLYEKVMTEEVDISSFNIVTHYEKPAIEMMDNVVRIGFCAS